MRRSVLMRLVNCRTISEQLRGINSASMTKTSAQPEWQGFDRRLPFVVTPLMYGVALSNYRWFGVWKPLLVLDLPSAGQTFNLR